MKSRDGFLSSVTLKAVDKKTKEVISLPQLRLPEAHRTLATRETAVEARHLAAAFALFRVCSMKNMQVMLPPAYRKYWTDEFQAIKTIDLQLHNEWMYAADPFQARKDRANAADARLVNMQKEAAPKLGTGLSIDRQRHRSRAWNDAPSVDIGRNMRFRVQDVLKRYAAWNRFGSTLSCEQRDNIVKDLLKQGFRQTHIGEAARECGDQQEARAFLLTYLPEDDLPKVSRRCRCSFSEQKYNGEEALP